MWYVYVLESDKNGDLYKGFCGDLQKRICEHNAGTTRSTKNGIPWKLIYCETFVNKDDAIAREKYLKTGWGRNFLKTVLKNYFNNQNKSGLQ
jgi:putative endonuclease